MQQVPTKTKGASAPLTPSYFKLHVRWLCSLLGPPMGLASARLLQTVFKSVPDRFVTRITYWS
ncbi:hypothetical protein CV016_03140 [Yersinia kristensenii]|nr:hypothetical protein CU276_07610 [Yersinia kristensenii]PJG64054.1 hypothetical protein CV016_03140 [Yersinia kristensenii]